VGRGKVSGKRGAGQGGLVEPGWRLSFVYEYYEQILEDSVGYNVI
jgi:hypothetical protein